MRNIIFLARMSDEWCFPSSQGIDVKKLALGSNVLFALCARGKLLRFGRDSYLELGYVSDTMSHTFRVNPEAFRH